VQITIDRHFITFQVGPTLVSGQAQQIFFVGFFASGAGVLPSPIFASKSPNISDVDLRKYK
jgi:hypothetical protein